jgi:flagellar biosynthesis/type III secretory pathway chaperone
MASLIEELITVLDEEDKTYKELVELANQKTPVIIKGDLDGLRNITSKEQDYIEVLNRLEKRRSDAVKDIALVLNKKESDLTIKTIITLLEGQPKEQNQLAEVHDSLRQTLSNISTLNDMNKNLIKSSLEMTEFNINLIKSMYQAPELGNYGKDANNTESSLNYGVFDAKN